jgi:tripartite-type tricarboxylate transporter receptor subunit TctC
MTPRRRNLVLGFALAPLLPSGMARAQGGAPAAAAAYPTKPIMMVIPTAPGAGLDLHARAITDHMSKELGQPFVMDYKPGAGGTIGTAGLARAPADGYTVMISTTAPLYSAPFLYSKLAYDVRRDFAFISRLTEGGLVFVAHKDLPANTLGELVAWVKQQGVGKVSYGSYGTGGTGHMLNAFFGESRGLGLTHVPYRGESPLLQALVTGEVPFGITGIPASLPHFASGRIKALAVFGSRRAQPLPNVPTMAESGFPEPEYGFSGGLILLAPAGTPASTIARLEAAARNASRQPAIQAKFLAEGVGVIGSTGEELRQHFETSLPAVERLVKTSGARQD